MNTRDQWILNCLEEYSQQDLTNVSDKLKRLLFCEAGEREDLLEYSNSKTKNDIFKELMSLELVV